MSIRSAFEKILAGQRVTEDERAQLLDWSTRAENLTIGTNPVTGQVSIVNVGPTQTEINAMVQQALTSKSWISTLSDISNQIGLIVAGEFRVGNGKAPGDGFTGGRFGWPGFAYGSDTYFLAGVANDVLQVGLSLTDGKIYAGAGAVVLGASSSTIGGWVITDTTIRKTAVGNFGIILDSDTPKITVGDFDNISILISGDSIDPGIYSSNFTSGQAGFKIAASTGDAEFNNIVARGELKTFLFTSSNQMAVAGNIIVSKDAGKLGADVTNVATTVNFGKALTVGNWIKIQGPDANGSNALEWILIGTLVSGTTYNVTRNVDGSGANAWAKDTPFVVIGASGDSRIELVAGSSAGISLITQGAAWNTQTTQASMSTVDGALTAGAGNVVINSSGITMANSATSWFNFKDASGGSGTVNIANDPNNDFEFVNLATSPAGTISFFLKASSSGLTNRVLQMKRHASIADAFDISFETHSTVGGRASFGVDHYIDYLKSDGTGSATVYFNERNKDIDFNVQTQGENNAFYVDAGLDASAFGGAPSSSCKLKVYGALGVTAGIMAETNANDIFRVNSSSTSAFSGTINGTPSGTSVVYNAGFTGSDTALVPAATTQLGKLRLYNTTRGTSALISNCNTGTKTITLTATVPAAWANGDTITIASQTVSGGTGNWVDIEITSGPTDKSSMFLNCQYTDTATAASTNVGRLHPTETFSASKIFALTQQVASFTYSAIALMKITTNLFSASWITGGTGTVTFTIREAGYLQ